MRIRWRTEAYQFIGGVSEIQEFDRGIRCFDSLAYAPRPNQPYNACTSPWCRYGVRTGRGRRINIQRSLPITSNPVSGSKAWAEISWAYSSVSNISGEKSPASCNSEEMSTFVDWPNLRLNIDIGFRKSSRGSCDESEYCEGMPIVKR